MATILLQYLERLHSVQCDLTRDWIFLHPAHVLLGVGLYLLSIWAGIRFMRRREALNLGAFPIVYNAICAGISVYLVYAFWREALSAGYSIVAVPVDYSPSGRGMATVFWVYTATKYLEFIDTWIMIAKKNFHQISVLHVFHHASMPITSYLVAGFAPSGEPWLWGMQNSFVHVVMYSYYLLCFCEGHFNVKFLDRRWKYLITYLQIVQFSINLCQYAADRYLGFESLPVAVQHYIAFYNVLMIAMFSNFLIRASARERAAAAAAGKKKDPAAASDTVAGKTSAGARKARTT
jgi:elongation of very long chain fatty acids protein 4